MTESKWLTSTDPAAMLEFLTGSSFGPLGLAREEARIPKPSDRKLRLFAVAVTRMALAMRRKSLVMLEDAETAERFADGLASASDMAIARISSDLWCCDKRADMAATRAAVMVTDRATETADLLRDIIGNPFRPVVLPAAPHCKAWCPMSGAPPEPDHRLPRVCGGCGYYWECPWLTSTVTSLAQAAYDHRDEATGHLDPVRLAILADALEEAGCVSQSGRTVEQVVAARGSVRGCCERSADNQSCECLSRAEPHPLLAHLRSPGPHVRGCWAVDLILGKE